MADRLQNFFHFFDDLYCQHEKTFDPSHMRDFIDVYCAERKRVMANNLRRSSFYGEDGRLNYVNTMFDLFLVFINEKLGQFIYMAPKKFIDRYRDNYLIPEISASLHYQFPLCAKEHPGGN